MHQAAVTMVGRAGSGGLVVAVMGNSTVSATPIPTSAVCVLCFIILFGVELLCELLCCVLGVFVVEHRTL